MTVHFWLLLGGYQAGGNKKAARGWRLWGFLFAVLSGRAHTTQRQRLVQAIKKVRIAAGDGVHGEHQYHRRMAVGTVACNFLPFSLYRWRILQSTCAHFLYNSTIVIEKRSLQDGIGLPAGTA
ncbi:MAG: hypothetical protein WCY72_12550 [Lysobacteraceae bacterium]